MYTIYTTNAFVIALEPRGEADMQYTLYTEQFGLITAVAKSIRKIESKLKSHLPQYGYVSVSLVRGREVWRITSSQVLFSLYDKRIDLKKRQLIARAVHFIERVAPGELPHTDVFHLYETLCKHILSSSNLEIQILENILQLNILSVLGYKTDHDDAGQFVILSEKTQGKQKQDIENEFQASVMRLHTHPQKETLILTLSSEITRILKETHL